jgi:hypothetical protein
VLRRGPTPAAHTDATGGHASHDQRSDDPAEESHGPIMADIGDRAYSSPISHLRHCRSRAHDRREIRSDDPPQ